ncbi:MAG: YbaB/EbfC family nucleoid-associated protein [Actinobacteria bacterium]|nr:YbaB/EbfC family nucleoid-associated protein [Actinomycetota bacterium]MTA63769.1 YbaB/EbfC family nucleoid-associated protein [Actinomycetota bacterium]
MMEMAQNMQQQAVEAQQQLASTQLVGSAGGGVVSVTLNGHLHLVGLRIDPAAVDAEDLSILEDLIRAAWQDAYDQVAQLQAQVDPMAGMGDIGDLLGGL